MTQTRINTGILDGKAKTFKKITKNLKNNVDNLTQWCYYNQVATRDERHESFSNTDKYWI